MNRLISAGSNEVNENIVAVQRSAIDFNPHFRNVLNELLCRHRAYAQLASNRSKGQEFHVIYSLYIESGGFPGFIHERADFFKGTAHGSLAHTNRLGQFGFGRFVRSR
jgi:hypothetical protein